MHTFNMFDRAARIETALTAKTGDELTVLTRMVVCDSDHNYNERPLMSILVGVTVIDGVYADHRIVRIEEDNLHDDFAQSKNADYIVAQLLPAYIDFKSRFGYENHTRVFSRFYGRLFQPVIHEMVIDQLPAYT